MLFIVEIPHRLPPRAWVAESKPDFITKVEATCPHDLETFDQAAEYLRDDLHSCVILTIDEAREYEFGGHWAFAAQFALDDLLERWAD